MSKKDVYETYLDQSAAAANSAGVAHSDPNVNARQARLAGGTGPAAMVGSGSALAGVFILAFILIPFVGYYSAFLDAFTQSGFDLDRYMKTGHFRQNHPSGTRLDAVGLVVGNRFLEAAMLYVVIGVGFFTFSHRIGYALFSGLVMIPMIGIVAEPVSQFSIYGFTIPALVYLLGYFMGHPRFVLPGWLSLGMVCVLAALVAPLSPRMEAFWHSVDAVIVIGGAMVLLLLIAWILGKIVEMIWG